MIYRHSDRGASSRLAGRSPGEMRPGLVRSTAMSSNMVVYLMAGLTMIISVLGVFGLPAIAIVLVKYFKLKEREMALEMEYRQKAHEQQLAHDDRVQRLEDVLTSLDHDVRERLGIGGTPATPLTSRPELVEGPAAADAPREQSSGRSRT